MISIIICSVNKEALDAVTVNIEQTINTPYELIVINNGDAPRGICEVYNEGAAKARYELLCFMHEDICFETHDWGNKVARHLADKRIGLIGFAGGDTKSLAPSSWASLVQPSEISLIQHYKHTDQKPMKIITTAYANDTSAAKRVACIDGVWMCTRKEVFDKFRFDSSVFRGFHGYDIDFSLQVGTAYHICVVFDILCHHFSEGSYNKAWLESAMLVSDKWKKRLPVSVRNLSEKEKRVQHWTAMRSFLDKLIELDYPLFTMLHLYLKYTVNRFFGVRYFMHFIKYAFVRYKKQRSIN